MSSVRIADLRVKIWTQSLPNTKQDHDLLYITILYCSFSCNNSTLLSSSRHNVVFWKLFIVLVGPCWSCPHFLDLQMVIVNCHCFIGTQNGLNISPRPCFVCCVIPSARIRLYVWLMNVNTNEICRVTKCSLYTSNWSVVYAFNPCFISMCSPSANDLQLFKITNFVVAQRECEYFKT
jgi:hypothetical protein